MFDSGHVQLSRKLFEHHFWSEERTYSRAEAWIDLVQSAAFRAGKRMVSGSLIEVPRGGIVASVRFLSDRWKWSNTKVCLYLDLLRSERMITTEKRQGVTVISLCKYDRYNPEKRRENDNETTLGRQRNDEIEEGNNGNNLETPPARETPSLETVQAYERWIATDGHKPPEDQGFAQWWHDEQEKAGWIDQHHRPLVNWQAGYRSARAARRHNEQESKNRKPYDRKSAHDRTAADRERDRTGITPAHIPTNLL